MVNDYWENYMQYCYGGVSDMQKLNVTYSRKTAFAYILVSLNNCLKQINNMCRHCDLHAWWLCGGAAAWLLGKTNKFTNLDVYVICDGDYYDVDFVNNHAEIPFTGIGYNVTFHLTKFPLKATHNITAYMDMFCLYVLSTFDLPICRVGIHFPIRKAINEYNLTGTWTCKVIDVSCMTHLKNPVTSDRINKYNQRIVKKHKKTCCNLKLMISFEKMFQICSMSNVTYSP